MDARAKLMREMCGEKYVYLQYSQSTKNDTKHGPERGV